MALVSGLLAACAPERTTEPTSAGTPTIIPPIPTLRPPTAATVLQTLRAGHPRLLALPDDVAHVKQLLASDTTAQRYYAALNQSATALLKAAPSAYELATSDDLLGVSREVVDRIYTLALLYRLDGDQRWAARAATELRAVAAFPDWSPGHFLDTAEMTHAVAIGYDWLYDALPPDDRATLRAALREKGLRPGLAEYERNADWVSSPSNWNNVCNGGLICGALAIADEEPELASTILMQAYVSLPHALAAYTPDGAWAEGPSYWSYATRYTTVALAALSSALGTDLGMGAAAGLGDTGAYRLHVVGPTNTYFNYADAEEKVGDDPALFWLARAYRQPAYAVAGRVSARKPSARDLLWYTADGSADDVARQPLDRRFTGAQLAFFRSAWNDPNALYLAFKGGNNGGSHAHLDLGTFVLDALGQRWALDLGRDGYSLPGYFGAKRWSYYRLRTEGHNTLTFGGMNQDEAAVAPLVAFGSAAGGGFAVADLSSAYAVAGAARVRRGVMLFGQRRRVLIQDEITGSGPLAPVWAMHTAAQVQVAGTRATLRLGSATLSARILSPAGAEFAVEPVDIPAPQKPARGISKLMLHLAAPTTDLRIAVVLEPGPEAGDAPLQPLDSWQAEE